ncbi:MAG: hypothetical protein HOP17_04805, partial [Acidobacteria bacterium]|nr:hypothetical protein [Acidobacteriota bacterium]
MKLSKIINDRSIFISLLLFLAFTFLACNRSNPTPDALTSLFDSTFDEPEVPDSEGKFAGKNPATDWKVREALTKKKENLNTVVFVNKKNGWLLAPRKLFKTDDAGSTWKTLQPELPDGALIAHVEFADERNGWLAVQKYPKSFYDDDFDAENVQLWILVTSDGGETWLTQITYKGVDISTVEFADAKIGAVIGRKYIGGAFQTEYFLTMTEDGGESWTNMSQALNESKAIEDIESPMKYANDRPEVLIISDPNQIKFITHSRRVLETADRGKTWRKRSQYQHDDAQVGIKNFGYKDDGTEWMFESTYSIEGIRARLKTRDAENRLTRNVIHGVYLSNAYYLGGNGYIASGQTGDFRNLSKA